MLPFQQDYEDEVCVVDLLLHTILQLQLDLYIQLSVISIIYCHIIQIPNIFYILLLLLTLILGNVLFSGVLFTPGILPADLPSHS